MLLPLYQYIGIIPDSLVTTGLLDLVSIWSTGIGNSAGPTAASYLLKQPT